MKIEKLKTILSSFLFFVGTVGFEILLFKSSLPISALDIILTPLVLITLFYLFKVYILDKKKDKLPSEVEKSSFLSKLGFLLFSFALFALGTWCIYAGFLNPFTLFTGVKGSLHGYSLSLIGLLIIVFSLIIFYGYSKQIYLLIKAFKK